MMKNFNIRYECLDAHDDYRAQLKKGSTQTFVGSWEVADEEIDTKLHRGLDAAVFDDVPDDPLDVGPRHVKQLREKETINNVLNSTGWIEPIKVNNWELPHFQPEKGLNGSGWELEIAKQKQAIQEKKNAHNKGSRTVQPTGENADWLGFERVADTVKIVDKSYLEKSFRADVATQLVDVTVKMFSLNTEQERAFRIMANHAVSKNPEQLRMHLGGMGGTGKTQVIKAITTIFEARNESHRFIIVAPTGTAAALLGGSTYHHMFGINDRMSLNKIGNVKAKLNGVEYVFFDEVSMLSARDLHRINAQLARVFDIAEIPFGGLNMVFSGDFAQLPPAIGGEHVSLYSRTIGTVSTDKKSQEEAIGKALWHQITTVVILRQNMRQSKQSAEDTMMRTALENLRYKACTPVDINFWRTKISSSLPGRSSICNKEFRDVSIITGTNLQKDEINRLGAIRFAQETGQDLVDFYSEDTSKVSPSNLDKVSGTKRVAQLTNEMQKALWDQQPSTTDKHIAGKLTLCLGLPVMICTNYATELCMTRGQEGYVHGWQTTAGSQGQRMLDTLFVKLKTPPTTIQIDGLPENIVPVCPTTNSIRATLPNDESYCISRKQVEVLVNFAMTDFASQGKTRPFNVADLNNLSNHQAYYTALSRSSTAQGTLILQGFDARKMTGGCSGALRQEFRELELLDEITKTRYMGKLPPIVTGATRNAVISSFRKWKGVQYVPNVVHPALRWSKRDPLPESQPESYDFSQLRLKNAAVPVKLTHTAIFENTIEVAPSSTTTPNAPAALFPGAHFAPQRTKRERSESITEDKTVSTAPKTKRRRCDNVADQVQVSNAIQHLRPVGMKWSENSCAYDSVFTILFNIWQHDHQRWSFVFEQLGNEFCTLLSQEFEKYHRKEASLEAGRDVIRRELGKVNRLMRFGEYTSIEQVCQTIFSTGETVYEVYYQCPSHHRFQYYQGSSIFIEASNSFTYRSTSQWMETNSWQGTNRCHACGLRVSIETSFSIAPPLLALGFSRCDIEIDHSIKINVHEDLHRYNLAGVVYFKSGESHFVSNIIMEDNQIWYYDGLVNGGQMVNIRPLDADPATLNTCRGGSAVLALYAKDLSPQN